MLTLPRCWGESRLALHFADMTFGISGLNTLQQQTLASLYASVVADESSPVGMLETWAYRQRIPKTASQRYDKNGIYTPIVQRRGSGVAIEAYGFRAAIVLEPVLSGSLYAEDGGFLATRMVFENYLRIFAAYAIAMRGGLLLHSAGIVVDGKAYLFLGRSGAGKTTLSRLALAADVKILSDDINIVFPARDGGFVAGAIPFAGELGHACLEPRGHYPLGGLFWLEKSGISSAESIAFVSQYAKLLACCPVINSDSHQLDRVLAIGKNLLTFQPLRIFHFCRNERFAAIFKVMQGRD